MNSRQAIQVTSTDVAKCRPGPSTRGAPRPAYIRLAQTLGNRSFAHLLQTKQRPGSISDQTHKTMCHCGGVCPACQEAGADQLQRKQTHGSMLSRDVSKLYIPEPGTGKLLDPGLRAFFEPRFGHDLSAVRIHTDNKAAQTARALNARAFTVGTNIVFDRGEYAPATQNGRHLLAHELTHTLQQGRGGPRIQRRIRVQRPNALIPNPSGRGRVQSNAQTVEQYLRTLAPEARARVGRLTGRVRLAPFFCPLRAFRDIGRPSRAARSGTPESSTCLCDLVRVRQMWNIIVDDQIWPRVAGDRVYVQSPNSERLTGVATMSGGLPNLPPWQVLLHELCGHAWLDARAEASGLDFASEEGPQLERAPMIRVVNGQVRLMGSEPTREQFLRHGRTVERENRLRREHGLEPRGYRLRDPYCGESFWRERSQPQGTPNWTEINALGVRTYLEICQHLRDRLPESRTRRFGINERIP